MTAIDPGYTATDLNGLSGTQSVTEGTAGTDAIVKACSAETVPAVFFDRSGPLPW